MVKPAGIRWYAALGLAILAFFALNRLTPPVADDWFYACRLGYDANGLLTPVARLNGVGDILPSMKCLYIAHSGRVPVHTLVQLFSLLPRAAFDLANALVFTGLLVLLVLLARPRDPMAAALAAVLAAGLYCLEQLSASPLPAAALCGVLAIGAVGLIPGAVADLAALRAVTDGRAAYILAQKEQGIREVTAPVALPAATRFNPLWGDSLTDLAQNPAGERNRALALYHGVEAVRGDPGLTAKFIPGGTP